jgi:hypothetical protein
MIDTIVLDLIDLLNQLAEYIQSYTQNQRLTAVLMAAILLLIFHALIAVLDIIINKLRRQQL